MFHFDEEILEILYKKIGDFKVSKVISRSNKTLLYKITNKEFVNFFLKQSCCEEYKFSLNLDFQNYLWLDYKVPIPDVILYKKIKNVEYLCLREIQGHTLDFCVGQYSEEEIVTIYAKALKRLHSVKIDFNTPRISLDFKLSIVKYNIENQLVNIEELQPENKVVGLNDLYTKLLNTIPANHEIVFTHGDFCFDNIIFNNKQLMGFIDIGRGGLADRYQDIALAVRNIKDFFSDDFLDLFYKVYGLNNPNEDKIEFYILLDEFL